MRVALRIGTTIATAQAAIRNAIVAAIVIGSRGVVWKSCDARNFESQRAAIRPAAIPAESGPNASATEIVITDR